MVHEIQKIRERAGNAPSVRGPQFGAPHTHRKILWLSCIEFSSIVHCQLLSIDTVSCIAFSNKCSEIVAITTAYMYRLFRERKQKTRASTTGVFNTLVRMAGACREVKNAPGRDDTISVSTQSPRGSSKVCNTCCTLGWSFHRFEKSAGIFSAFSVFGFLYPPP